MSYNPTAPFESAGRHVIAGRVERRDSEQSQVRFFERGAQGWHLIPDAPTLALQIRSSTFIGATLVLGGVETFDIGGRLHWRTVFLRGPDIFNLSRFLVGPDGMKDIRLTQLADGRIGIFTRPQGAVGGRGTIGYIEADHLGDHARADQRRHAAQGHVPPVGLGRRRRDQGTARR